MRGLPIRNRRDALATASSTSSLSSTSSAILIDSMRKNETNYLNRTTGAHTTNSVIISDNHLSKLSLSKSGATSSRNSKEQQQQLNPRFSSAALNIKINNSNKLQQMNKQLQQQQPKLHLQENRNRRKLSGILLPDKGFAVNSIISDHDDNINDKELTTITSTTTTKTKMTKSSTTMSTSAATIGDTIIQQRSRRDAPGCIVNYKAQRQLWIGCTGPNVIDVRPQCNDDGDEGKLNLNNGTFSIKYNEKAYCIL